MWDIRSTWEHQNSNSSHFNQFLPTVPTFAVRETSVSRTANVGTVGMNGFNVNDSNINFFHIDLFSKTIRSFLVFLFTSTQSLCSLQYFPGLFVSMAVVCSVYSPFSILYRIFLCLYPFFLILFLFPPSLYIRGRVFQASIY